LGRGRYPFPTYIGSEGKIMFTISDILKDIDRGIMANNMVEDRFSYRIIFFVNEGNDGHKHYIDTTYNGMRKSLESIVRNYLSVTNSVVIAETTVLKNGESVCLQSKSYSFNLNEYFRQISGDCTNGKRNGRYNRYAVI